MQGICTNLAQGAAPHGNRAACTTDGSSCGGSCDGAGACSYSTGACGSATCSGSGPYTSTPAATCNGAGKCVAQAAKSCGAYACNGSTSCYLTCTAPSQCVAGDICSGSVCQACSGGQPACGNSCCGGSTPVCVAGACKQCQVTADCTAQNYFACGSNNTCVCRPQSGTNLLRDPGFDTNLSGWNVNDSSTAKSWASVDSEGCPKSGSLLVNGGQGDVEQCVPASPNIAYNIGFKYKQAVAGSFRCIYTFYDDSSCSQDSVGDNTIADSTSTGTSWIQYATTVLAPAGSLGLDIVCGSSGTANMDEFYINPSGTF